MVRLIGAGAVMMVVTLVGAGGQTPQPFPRAGSGAPQQPATRPAPPQPAPRVPSPETTAPAPPPSVTAPATANAESDPAAAAAALGVTMPASAQFLTSYDAGQGQRYYVFGSTAPYAELVTYFRTQLKDRGDQVFAQPLTHMFQVGRFRDESMAFPPGVTVKDWTTGGSQGYPNPRAGAQPARFPTILMVVPPPPATAAAPAR